MTIDNKTILLFGGTGSLGECFISRYINNNIIYNVSRDENKHWNMKLQFNNHRNLNFIICDIINSHKVNEIICRVRPNIIIIASAMKHIDQCEYNMDQSLNTNLLGVKNILDSVDIHKEYLKSYLEVVLFVSSDKACSPVNVYGMCKALSESLIVEKSLYCKEFKFVNIRYGNVLNSRGSIIPMLQKIGNDKNKEFFTLTDTNMTRFIMTLEQSVDLIDYTINNADTGDTVIPQCKSMYCKDLFEIYAEKYHKPIKVIGIRPGEKLYESLINDTQSLRIEMRENYYHIKSMFHKYISNNDIIEYTSKSDIITKEELENYLDELKLI